MIDESRTLEIYGYISGSLSHGSHKKVVAVCENCGKYREIEYKAYRNLCISCAEKGKHVSNETRQKMSASRAKLAGKNAPFFGKKHSGETRQKMSAAQKGKQFSEEHCRNISKACCGRHLSEETKRKISDAIQGAHHPCYGKHLTEETKKKISKANTGKHHSKEAKKRMSETRLGRRWSKDHKDVSGKNSHAWRGGISFGKYCHLFNRSFKEVIRNRYNRKCFLCPTTEEENGRKLSVHHVQYDKNCLCGSKCEFVPLCDSCHSKTNFNRRYWEDLIMCYLYPDQAWLPDI